MGVKVSGCSCLGMKSEPRDDVAAADSLGTSAFATFVAQAKCRRESARSRSVCSLLVLIRQPWVSWTWNGNTLRKKNEYEVHAVRMSFVVACLWTEECS